MRSVDDLRIGNGFDVHVWSSDPARVLVLGGVRFEGQAGLHGYSDADAVAHAVIDAVLGATGAGDIGEMFPDTDPANAGADSIELLSRAVDRIGETGWRVVNVDCTVVVDEPRIGPVKAEMERNLSVATGAPVTVKGKRTEGFHALAEGIQCYASALVARR